MKVRVEVSERVAQVTIDRPEALNALDAGAYRELSEAWTSIRDDDDIWVAVLTGSGEKAFCVGADLKEAERLETSVGGHTDALTTAQPPLLNRGLELWKPVVAAVNGYCLGGGLTMLLATDIRIAAQHAVFGLSEVAVGLIPGNGGTQRILDQVPYALGMEMLLSARRLTASEALGAGLVNRVVPQEDLLTAAHEVAQRICANGPLAVQAAKELAVRSRQLALADGLRLEQGLLAALRATEDAREGRQAFLEGRKPRFSGR